MSVVARTAAPVTVGAAVLAGAALGIVAVGALADRGDPVGVGRGDEHPHGVGLVGGADDVAGGGLRR